MVGASNSWHPTTIHCFLVWVLTASRGLELGIDPGIATSTGPRVCWDSVKVEPMGEIPAVLWMELDGEDPCSGDIGAGAIAGSWV